MNPDSAAHYILPTFVVLLRFPLNSSVSSILQFLGNFMRSFPDEDDFSSPVRCTNVFSRVELGLPNDLPLIIVVSEIQALALTHVMHILNFFVLNSGAPCCTQSSLVLSEQNFHHQ